MHDARTLVARFRDVVLAAELGRRRLPPDHDSRISRSSGRLDTARRCVFHAANISAVCRCVACSCSRSRGELLPLRAAWLAAALFAVHPVHVEAVANVVGQSELLVACALLCGDGRSICATGMPVPLRPRRLRAIAAAVRASRCFSKEHGIVLPAILVAAELTIIDDATPFGERARSGCGPFYLALAPSPSAFIAARSRVLADHGHRRLPAVHAVQHAAASSSSRSHSHGARRRARSGCACSSGRRISSSEYGPPDIEIAQGLSSTQIPGFLLLVAIDRVRGRPAPAPAGHQLRHRVRRASTLLPSSNFSLPAGIVLAERTLFLPSVGAMLVVGGVGGAHRPISARARFAAARAIASALMRRQSLCCSSPALRAARREHGSGTTTMRCSTRRSSTRRTRIARTTCSAPGTSSRQRMRARRSRISRKALSSFPYDPAFSYNLAEQYRARRALCQPALPLYRVDA